MMMGGESAKPRAKSQENQDSQEQPTQQDTPQQQATSNLNNAMPLMTTMS
jgi:hypothetical protein